MYNSGTSTNFTPLMAAAVRGEAKIAESILQMGCDKILKDNQGRNALWYASLFNKTNVALMLLGKEIEVLLGQSP